MLLSHAQVFYDGCYTAAGNHSVLMYGTDLMLIIMGTL